MKMKNRVLILITVAVLSIMALVAPRFTGQSEFQVTSQPLVAFQAAQKSDTPIFLEFYAKW
ncbi:hypothetical protein [Desulfosporosinus sp. OT]|uniref:hypothetical protein n=1 Tax=Desulfosporosinus sp. OT TaxID=913865 RepID=UPI000223AF09|nr:hypothetical protein [Desulfosporosinus sp. OT]EGW39635.1 hypothetical protein DOT_2478 [Desulfosporosinus sp. OT]